jgi:hypothetical protein
MMLMMITMMMMAILEGAEQQHVQCCDSQVANAQMCSVCVKTSKG